MAIKFEYMRPIRAKAQMIRAMVNAIQHQANQIEGTLPYYDKDGGASLKNPIDYNAGFSYLSLNVDTTSIIQPNVTPSAYVPMAYFYANNLTPSEDINNFPNIRGYLTVKTVQEIIDAKGYVIMSRLYRNHTARNANARVYYTDTKTAVDDAGRYGAYVVPYIRWFYDKNGEPTELKTQPVYAWYFYTASAAMYKKYKEIVQFPYYAPTTATFSQIVTAGFTAPYIWANRESALTRDGIFSGGSFKLSWSGTTEDSRYITLRGQDDSCPYTILYGNTKAPTAAGKMYKITDTDGVGYSAGNISLLTGEGGNASDMYPAYKDVQSIINLFDDYGVFLSTDLNEVLAYQPTDDGVINPDNPADELPYYPDNTTDTTPIEPAYITPSTFGQTLVYNPTTTRDFLTWICDNTVNIDNWRRLFANPVDVIMGINLYNLDIPAHDTANTRYNQNTNILGVSTNIPNYSILGGYNNIVDGGTLTLQAYYGNYADFTSMTYQMFIPFVGFTTLRACDVVNKQLHLFYAVDFATGAAVAFVNSDDKLIYTAPCTVAGKIPVSTSDKNNQIINNTLAAFSSIGGLLGGIASGNVGGGVGALVNGLGSMQMQTNYSNKGSLSAVNIYKLLPAFIERTRYDLFFPTKDQQYLGAKYQSAAGAPSTQFDTLLNCVDAGGFVQSDVVYITSATATETEKQQIIDLIKSGIYL